MSANFISIETATNVCSVAAFKAGKLAALSESEIVNSHSANITLFMNAVLRESKLSYGELNAVAISEGPGSYTGLRIGASVAKALAYTLNIPIIAYNTLLSIICGVLQSNTKKPKQYYGAAIDARRDEVYLAICTENLEEVLPPTNMILKKGILKNILNDKKLIISGSGGEKVKNITENCSIIYDHFVKCSSKFSIELITHKYQQKQFTETTYFEPNYMKPFFTLQKTKI